MLNWWLPENVSTYGRDIDWLFHRIYWITGITFLVAVTMLAFIVMYRDRPGRRALHPRQHPAGDRVDHRARADPGGPHAP
jgi:heme/copper-type cytochrome/quinol oxidase subunit 2